jgi:hypothetical protein
MISTAVRISPSPAEIADDAVRRMLRSQYDGEPIVRLDSPPGAGKTGIVERLAGLSLGRMQERCMVVTQTNEQAFEITRRMAGGFPKFGFALLARKDLDIPESVTSSGNVIVVRKFGDLPDGPCVVVGNSEKWTRWDDRADPFDLQIVDEAFQLPDHRFSQIAGLARRIVLVGDPGQISPIVTCETERWRHDPAGPHVACPEALIHRHPGVPWMKLPVSRRLVPDTVRFVQPAFYPDLPFIAMSVPGERVLKTGYWGRTIQDKAIDMAGSGASIVQLDLPAGHMGEVDDELSDSVIALIGRLIRRRAFIRNEMGVFPLEPDRIGVVCAHVSQVNSVRERLSGDLSGVFVETADRFQGLERPVMIVHHPLSGRSDATEFHLDAGRMCVMMSRHSVACFVLGRTGIDRMLDNYMPSGNRILGIEDDPEFEGWNAHRRLLRDLTFAGRVIQHP